MESKIEFILIIFLIFMLGASFGSFISALVYRREEGISIISPPSFCDYCGEKIQKRDLVPVFSFLFLRGVTRCCGKKISIDKILIEILAGLIFLFIFIRYDLVEGIFLAFALVLSLLVAYTDYKFLEIYDRDLKALISFGFIYRIIFLRIDYTFLKYCLVFSAGFILVRWISKGGLGDGDLFFYLGLFCFLKNPQIIFFILLSIWVGASFAIIKAIRQKSLRGTIALCPAIFLAFFIVLIFKDLL